MLFGFKYLYPNSGGRPGYRIIASKGNQSVSKTFPKDQLEEAKAFAKEVEERFDKIEATNPRPVTGKKLTVYNKYARDITDGAKNYNDLTTAEKNIVQTRYRQSGGNFRKTFQTNELTDLNKERIKKAFPDVEFEFTKGKKYGVIKELKNGKRNPVFTAINNFVNNNYKLSTRKSLPVSTQRDIVARFELPKGVKEWNFDVKKGGYVYGIPDTSGANENLGKRIINFINEPKPYKIAADFGNPEGWLLTQMNRAYETKQNPNFIPKRDLVNGKKKIVGFTDNQYGGGKTYYALKKYAKKFNGTMMTEHPDFKNTKKYIDIANKVKLAPNKVIKDLLIKGGVTDDRVTLNNLLQYMINEKGVTPTKRALVLHHKGSAVANPTRDFQILNTAVNQNIKGVESAMRADPANITPKNIKFLKDAGASIIIDGTTYGDGPKTAIGGFRQAEQFVESNLQKYGPKEFTNFKKYLTTLASKNTHNICPVVLGIKGEATGGPAGCAAEMTQALDNDPVGVATKAKDLKVEGGAVNRIKNAATTFLKFAGKGKVFGITAGVGAGAGALVKQFRNDEPDTYLSDENQMKAMLVDTVEEDTLGKAAIGGELAAAGLSVPGSSALYKARRGKGFGVARSALGPVGKAASGFATPLGMALTTPLNVASQIRQGDSLEDIATNPLNYLGPAFAGTLTREATRGMNPQGILAKGLRLGMSPGVVRGVSRFFGLPGLALSLGYEGYDQYKKYKEGEGFIYNLLNKDE